MKKIILIDGNSLMFRSYYATAYTGNMKVLGLVRSNSFTSIYGDGVLQIAVHTNNGKTYYALSLETMGYSTGFYNSTSGTWLSTAQTSWAGTRLFTRDELLVGMLIWSDVNYRPEGWFDLDDTNPRNDNVSGVKEIDENWWYTQFLNSGNVVHDTPYVARGFNWQKGSNPPSAMYDHFVIYVPEDMIAKE